MGLVHGIWTLLLLLIFIGIVVWAWSARRKQRFEEAAQIPLQDDKPDSPENPGNSEKIDG